MTLTVAINIQDYIFLASDQRLTIECAPETNLPPKTYIDHYKKIKYWEYGAITVSGDVMLMHYFFVILQAHAKQNCWDFLQMAQEARCFYFQNNKTTQPATGTAFISIYTLDKVEIVHVSIKEHLIEYEVIEPMHAHFSLYAGRPDDPIYQVFVNSLKKLDQFLNREDFFNYHIELIKYFFTRQKRFDESITSSFDLFIQNTTTGKGVLITVNNSEP